MSSDADSSRDRDKEKARTFFQYGSDAALKNNHDYAIEMYQRACKIDPENLMYRQALRGIERRKFNNDPAKVGKLVYARLQGTRIKVKTLKAKKDWKGVIETCEEAFVLHPWDTSSARDAAEACEQLDYKNLAQWILESVQGQATEADFFRHLAHVEELNGAWPKAIGAWEKVKNLDPNDEIASRKINALSASATIQRAGLVETLDQRNEQAKAPHVPDASELEALAMQKLSPEQRLQKETQDHPERVGPFLELSDLYRSRNLLEEAEKVLARGLKANPADETLRMNHADVQIGRLKNAVEVLTKRCREKPSDAPLKAKLGEYTAKLHEYELKEFARRAKLHPEDLGFQLQLGIRLARAGKHQEAIGAFQLARSSPEHRTEALHQAGLSFEATGVLKLAERNYQEALKGVKADDVNTLNSLHYRLGRVAEAQGNTKDAEEHYNEVAANDYSYLDVAERLKNLALNS